MRRELVLAVTWLFVQSVANAATIEVTHLVDDANPSNGTCTLREAIRAANTNAPIDACPSGSATVQDQILVKAGIHRVDLTTSSIDDKGFVGDLDVLSPIWIHGASSRYTIIQGSAVGAIDRLIEIHELADDVRIEGVALRGGNASEGPRHGGVLLNLETGPNEVDLVDVELSGGRADRGGGIHNVGHLRLERCRVLDNHANEATLLYGAVGGGISSVGVDASLYIEDSEILANDAEYAGGGVWAGSGGLVVLRSRVHTNVSGIGGGGGLFVAAPGFEMQYSELAHNRADVGGGLYTTVPGEIQHALFLDNQGMIRGGGMADGGGAIVRFSTFTENAAPSGSAVHAATNQTLLDADTIANNGPGALYNQSGLFLENTLLARNGGASCVGAPPVFGAFNLEDVDSCGLAPTATGPNFPNTNPRLGALADNGGPTRSMALLAGSPAIDAISSEIRTNCQAMLDQRAYPRGRPRTKNAANEDVYHCDIGAFEAVAPFATNSLVDEVDATPDDDRCLTASGLCTLRAAVQQANAIPGMNEIALGVGTYVLTRTGTGENAAATGDLDLKPPVLLRGAGALQTTIDGGLIDRVFELGDLPPDVGVAPRTSFFRDLTITRGYAYLGLENGGGIALRSPLRLDRVTMTGNLAVRGSAISSTTSGSFFDGSRTPVEIVDSTIRANNGGGALFLADAVLQRSSLVLNVAQTGYNGGGGEFGRVLIENSTVSRNQSTASGAFFASSALIESSAIYDNACDFAFEPGGLYVLSLSAVRNSIIASNYSGAVLSNCAANPNALVSLGSNLTDGSGFDCGLAAPADQLATPPRLGVLAANGGPTPTHLLLADSPAIDRGDSAACSNRDQRATPRPRDGDGNGSAICDIGPVEVPEPSRLSFLASGVIALVAGARRGSSMRRAYPVT